VEKKKFSDITAADIPQAFRFTAYSHITPSPLHALLPESKKLNK